MKTIQQHREFVASNWTSFLLFSAFACVLFGIKLWLIGTYGNATPYWDQWDAEAVSLYEPYLKGTLGLTDLFAPHNEHRIFTTRMLALALLDINGIWNPLLQMVVNAILHIIALVMSINMLVRVIGRDYLPALLFFSLILFGVPYAWENTLAGFQSQFYFVLLFSIACQWFTVTRRPLSAGWWGGVVCALLAFFSLASGVFALAAAAVTGFVIYVMDVQRTRKQLLAVAILAGLFVLGAMLTPSIAGHAALKAASFQHFFDALVAVLGWPMPANFFSALIRNMPALAFVGIVIWKRPPASDYRWFLFALVVWSFGQAVSIAYGRAVGNLSSRYLDLFAIGILINFVCLIYLAREYVGMRRGWTIAGVNLWIILILLSLIVYVGKHASADLMGKRDIGHAQQVNVSNYLASGDATNLEDKPFLHVPYPDSERLASILASRDIRGILPTAIRAPLEPVDIRSFPAQTFVSEGYYQTTPKRAGMTLGSYSTQGDVATGEASIGFDADRQNAKLIIPVAGYPLSDGIKLEVEQNGQTIPVFIKSNPKESWGKAYAQIGDGAFSIKLDDTSTSTWVAVGMPSVTGRLDALINGLLDKYYIFSIFGFISVLLMQLHFGLTFRETKPVGL